MAYKIIDSYSQIYYVLIVKLKNFNIQYIKVYSFIIKKLLKKFLRYFNSSILIYIFFRIFKISQ